MAWASWKRAPAHRSGAMTDSKKVLLMGRSGRSRSVERVVFLAQASFATREVVAPLVRACLHFLVVEKLRLFCVVFWNTQGLERRRCAQSFSPTTSRVRGATPVANVDRVVETSSVFGRSRAQTMRSSEHVSMVANSETTQTRPRWESRMEDESIPPTDVGAWATPADSLSHTHAHTRARARTHTHTQHPRSRERGCAW